MTNRSYSVWAGGSEINSEYLDHGEAIALAEEWLAKGYDDVVVDNFARVYRGENEAN